MNKMKDLILNLDEESVINLKLPSIDLKDKKTKVIFYITDKDSENFGYFFIGNLNKNEVTIKIPAMPETFSESKVYKGLADIFVENKIFHSFQFIIKFKNQLNDDLNLDDVIYPNTEKEKIKQKIKEEVKDYLTEDVINSLIYDSKEEPKKENIYDPDLINEIFETACTGLHKTEHIQDTSFQTKTSFQPIIQKNNYDKPVLSTKAFKLKDKLKNVLKDALTKE
jgi:hypothetical protein